MGLWKLGFRRPSNSGRDNRNPLVEPDALKQIARTRRTSACLPRLREIIKQELASHHCLVIGSAPGGANLIPQHKCICVNASGWVAVRLGLAVPDLTVLGGWTLRGDSGVRTASIEALRNLRTRLLVFVESGLPRAEALEILRSANFSYDQFLPVSSLERAVILGDVAGEEIATGPGSRDRRPSMGIFAAALALWGGAERVTLTGFSLVGGHAYMNTETPRHHIDGDKRFLERVRGLPLYLDQNVGAEEHNSHN